MTLIIQQMALAVIGLFLLSGSYVLHVRLDQPRGGVQQAQRFMFLPQAEVLKSVSLGYHSVAADFLWLQAIQAMGEKNPGWQEIWFIGNGLREQGLRFFRSSLPPPNFP